MGHYFLSCLKSQYRPISRSGYVIKLKDFFYGYSSMFCAPTGVRFYLSPAFRCEEHWKSRLEDPLTKNIKPNEFYYELLRKYRKEGKVSSVDADIFFNSFTAKAATSLHEEIEEILRLLRRSPETVNTLESTPHTVVRLLLETKNYDLLLKVLSDPMNYGVFLDYYTASLLMDTFIKEGNFMGAARVASTLMLQEDFGPPLTQAYVLLSSLKYAFNEENEPWVDYNPVVEPEEEVKIVVRYVRNPYFDDHFDLKEPIHIVGKTLAWLSFHLEEDPALKVNAEVLGWSLYQKWAELKQSLEKIVDRKMEIDELVLTKVSSQIESCKDEEIKTEIIHLTEKITKSGLVAKLNIIEKAEEFVTNCSKNFESEFIENQIMTYTEWTKKRKEEVDRQLEMYEKRRLLQEIQEKKDDLAKREDVIFFFENQDKLDLLIERNEREREALQKLQPKREKKEDEIDDYIPPEV